MNSELMAILKRTVIPLPAFHVCLLIVITSICLILRCNKTGLCVAYAFVFWWGWRLFSEMPHQYMITYLVIGVVVGAIAIIGMLQAQD